MRWPWTKDIDDMAELIKKQQGQITVLIRITSQAVDRLDRLEWEVGSNQNRPYRRRPGDPPR